MANNNITLISTAAALVILFRHALMAKRYPKPKVFLKVVNGLDSSEKESIVQHETIDLANLRQREFYEY